MFRDMVYKNLIDIYIIPMVKTLNAGGTPDYTPLMYAMLKVAVFYGIGALSRLHTTE